MKSFSNHYEMHKCGPFKYFDIFTKYVCIFSLHIPVFVFTKYGRSKLQRLFTLRRLQLLALLYQLRENNYRRLLAAWICITIFSKIKKLQSNLFTNTSKPIFQKYLVFLSTGVLRSKNKDILIRTLWCLKRNTCLSFHTWLLGQIYCQLENYQALLWLRYFTYFHNHSN